MYKVKFADIGEGLTEGKVVEVLVKLGDTVKAGDSLFYVETDKVNSEIPAPTSGKIAKINIQTDQEIKVGDVVMEIDDGQKNVEASLDTNKSQETATTKSVSPMVDVEENASVVGSTPVSNDLLPPRAQQPINNKPTTNPEVETDKLQEQESQAIPQEQKTTYDYDVIVIGGGLGGYTTAIKSHQLGLKALVIEKDKYGGVCLNVGCIPTKALLKSAKLYEQTRKKTEAFGVELGDNNKVTLNWSVVQKRKNDVVEKLTNGVLYLLKKNQVDHIEGEALSVDNHSIKVNDKVYTGANLVIATGSKPNTLPLPGFSEAKKAGFLINSTEALSLPKVPKKVIIIGGGVIGVEFACLFSNFGAEVTLLQGLPTILEMLDPDISQEMTKLLADKYGVKIITNAQIVKIEDKNVIFEHEGREHKLSADYCLESVGRGPVLQGFDNLALDKDNRGFLKVANEYGQTNIPNIYAVGDINGHLMLAHVASHEGEVAANHIAAKNGLPRAEDLRINYDEVPSCVYSHPEIAVVGKTEPQCQREGINYKVYKFPFSAIGKAIVDGHPYGFTKVIVEEPFGKVLGAHIIGNRATEMISEITVLMEAEGTITELAHTIHPHPTMSEAIGETAQALWSGVAINI
ncbi:dihydrolipoamide dehydrogenase [Entomoplasma freundtii]|uniref:Dihydrolipoyl dehydrogenase n=1 Tax=Entomoplasma freundtii TaxID=74700 RepID=A0A2K8NTZ7_9MOLU|nr:dihydrolipoyl dehydrogenase [Entomoplasma freundtii]ATZ16231.1 pyruvate dehydrogenase E3 component [Entomoplasma freundtii]TDY56868.1 dihydrolipoamide dehydrogenase [Entomoplasma freundtii]